MIRYFACVCLLLVLPLQGCASISWKNTPLTCEFDGHIKLEGRLKKVTYLKGTVFEDDEPMHAIASISEFKIIEMYNSDTDPNPNPNPESDFASNCSGNYVRVKLTEFNAGYLQVGERYWVNIGKASELDTVPFSEWYSIEKNN